MTTQQEYDAKRQARYERLLAAVDRAERESAQNWKSASDMASAIPFGQPILVGHHSEGRDRRYRERIENKHRKGYELHQKAEQLRARAEAAAANRTIFSDDPGAVEKLEDKLARLEKQQEMMKSANKLVRKGDREGLLDMGFSPAHIDQLFTPDCFGGLGFPGYRITNNGANIRRLKERIEQVERQQSTPDKDERIGDIQIEWRASENRIRVIFPSRVDRPTFDKLRQHGFRAMREAGIFSAFYNGNAAYFIQELREKVTA